MRPKNRAALWEILPDLLRHSGIAALFRRIALSASCLAVSSCDDLRFPRDPRQTLETVLATEAVTVAAVDNPPWVAVDGEGGPEGAEVDLVEAFARELGVSIEWKRLAAFEALEGLESGDLDLAIGGFERKAVTPVAGAAPSYAYFHEALVIGARPEVPFPEELDGQLVFVPSEEPIAELVRNEGGTPVGEWSAEVALAAVPHWQLASRGLLPTGIVLQRAEHVVAVPQGENAWLMRIERFLRREYANMGERLREHQP
ncbi:MAG: ABC-type amino acid transport substrate-binding protein [Limimaricola cinnabarinus]|jgi:ABC-type amino acid transport substrate-binding protein|uniref:transporter substrate-binding domain-containing protein n=1 Tax=Limimaricola cinnabarinus TaxID=1125964 RepID=UPI0039E6B00C